MANTRKPWSSYWMGSALDRYREAESDAERLMQLSSIRKGIANFVNILTGTDIPVKFSSGEMSYTDGQNVVVISARNKPGEFDAQVGRALHEATHVVRSQRVFAWLRHFHRIPTRFVDQDLADAGMKVGRDRVKVGKDLTLMVNFLEDRRNDLWGYKQAPGYRPYYDSHYSQCFYSKEIDEALHHPKFRIPCMKVWELHILNMFSAKADADALPGLRKVWEIIDLPNIDRHDDDPKWEPWEEGARQNPKLGEAYGLDSPKTGIHYEDSVLPMMLVDAKSVLRIIYDNAVVIDPNAPPEDHGGDSEMNDFGAEPQPGEEFSDLENYDMPGEGEGDGEGKGLPSDKPFKPLTPEEMKKLIDKVKKALRRQAAEVMGQAKKDSLSAEDAETVNHLEASDAEMREVFDAELGNAKCKVIVYKKVNEDTLRIPSLGFSTIQQGQLQVCPASVKAVTDGKILGNLLAHKIRVMNDEGIVRVSRQKQGRFDKRLAASIAVDNDNLFFKTHTAQLEPVMVDLSIDASGSMAGEKWQKAMTLSIALAVAAAKIRSFRIRINVRASWGDTANVGVIYDSKRDHIKKIDTLFKYISPNGGTPEGLCYDAMSKELLEEIKQIRRFFINLSDGEPSFGFGGHNGQPHVGYYGPPACKHTKKQVDKLRQLGVRIMSFFICEHWQNASQLNTGGLHSQFQMMYGTDALYINPSDITEIAFSLNKKFLTQ